MGMFREAFCNYLFMLPFFVLMEFLLCRVYKRRGVAMGRGFIMGWQLFACLMTLILSITGAGCMEEAVRFLKVGGVGLGSEQINLVPIFRWGTLDPVGLGLNAVMFVPVGLMLPLLWQSAERFSTTIASGFGLSLLVELSQLCNARVTDVDDLIMNTLGAAAGFLIYRLLLKNVRLFKAEDGGGRGAQVSAGLIFAMYFLVGGSIIIHTWIAVSRLG